MSQRLSFWATSYRVTDFLLADSSWWQLCLWSKSSCKDFQTTLLWKQTDKKQNPILFLHVTGRQGEGIDSLAHFGDAGTVQKDSARASLAVTPVLDLHKWDHCCRQQRSRFYGNAIILKNNGVKSCVELKSSGLFWFYIAFCFLWFHGSYSKFSLTT